MHIEVLPVHEESIFEIHPCLRLGQLNLNDLRVSHLITALAEPRIQVDPHLKAPQKRGYHLVRLHKTDVLPNASSRARTELKHTLAHP